MDFMTRAKIERHEERIAALELRIRALEDEVKRRRGGRPRKEAQAPKLSHITAGGMGVATDG